MAGSSSPGDFCFATVFMEQQDRKNFAISINGCSALRVVVEWCKERGFSLVHG